MSTELTYEGYLRLRELLSLQERASSPDEHLFIVIHQTHELWFRQILTELTAARDEMFAYDLVAAAANLRRTAVIFKLLVEHWSVLSTLTPAGYLSFRATLGTGSGFQSSQFREIEFLCGLKEPEFLNRVPLTYDERARLGARLAEPALTDAFHDVLSRAGDPTLVELMTSADKENGELRALCEALMDVDENLAHWRARHTILVERQIGYKAGTGGSAGVPYLRSTLTTRLFPELWALRTEM